MFHPIEDFHKYIQPGKRVHPAGIGGVSMCALAEVLQGMGVTVQGSDMSDSATVQHLRSVGIPVAVGHSAENLKNCDAVIRTAAIHDNNPEIAGAVARGIPVYERAQAWGAIMQGYRNALCVSGTHGKTTTTSMTTQILLDAGIDPTCVIGGKLPAIHGSGRVGKSPVMVCEACEFVDTFLKLYPDIAVILNIDADHLDYFKTMENLIASFRKFAEKATKVLIVNGDDLNTQKAVSGLDKRILTFGYAPTNDYYPKNIVHVDGVTLSFDLCRKEEVLTRITLHIPGDHNILNAIAACVASHEAGATWEQCAAGLNAFHGAQRRFEVLGKIGGITVADDYGHHPTEIESPALQAGLGGSPALHLFPHRYTSGRLCPRPLPRRLCCAVRDHGV